jgi:hypothetical protein
MSVLLVDTNVASILFNRRHSLRQACLAAVSGHQLLISFMTRSELLVWPAANNRISTHGFGTAYGLVFDGIPR